MGKVGDSSDINPTGRPTLSEIPASLNLHLFPAWRQNKYPSLILTSIFWSFCGKHSLVQPALLNSDVCYIEEGRKSCVSASVIRVIAPHPFSVLLAENLNCTVPLQIVLEKSQLFINCTIAEKPFMTGNFAFGFEKIPSL